jgi:hypothetical protein
LPTVPAQKDAIDQPVSVPQSFYHMSLQKATTTPKIVLETFALLFVHGICRTCRWLPMANGAGIILSFMVRSR